MREIHGGSRLAVFDIDGVLADERHRTGYALARDWASYFEPERVAKDKVWPQGRRAYEDELMAGADVAYLTGRREDLRRPTQKWLRKKGFDDKAELIMRHPRHSTSGGWPLGRLKAEIMFELSVIYDGRVTLYEDDPAVCATVRLRVPAARVVHCTWHVKPERLVRRAVA